MHSIEFTDIRIRAALPLHPYLSEHPHLFLRLVADCSMCGATAGIDGDFASGVWEFNARLYAPRVKQSLNVAVLTGVKGFGVPVVSVTLKVAELLKRVKARRNGHLDFDIFDSGIPIQLKLVMTCSIKVSSILDVMSNAAADKGSTINSHSRNNESDFDPKRMHLSSREDLEGLYVKTNLMPDHDDSKAHQLSRLGYGFHVLHDKEHGKADLGKAISIHEEAMQLTGNLHPHLAEHACLFAMAPSERFQQSEDHIDIERAISYPQTGLRFTDDLDAARPFQLSNLGNALQLRFQRFGGRVDGENSTLCQREAIRGMPGGHPDKGSHFYNLALALQRRFERLGVLADFEDAISNHRQAVQLTPDVYPSKPSSLHHLGVAVLRRFRRLCILSDLESSLSSLSTAANSTIDSGMVRFNAARAWAKVAEEESRSLLDAFDCAINLLPRVAWLGLALTEQHALAEQGRSIVWQNLLGLRSPVDDLHETHRKLAYRLRSTAKQLEGSRSHLEVPTASAGDISLNYLKPANEWDRIVEQVRGIPDFEGFLKPKSFQQLAPAAHEGPVVILNVDDARCDALALISDDSVEQKASVVHIPLDRFSYEKSEKMFQTLTELLSSAGVRERNDRKTGRAQSQADGEAKFKGILGMLWEDVAKPVIEALAFPTESKRPPRIWWCATGSLAFLPIHAAGLYDTQEAGQKVSDYVVSSYTPTLTALLGRSDPMVQDDFQVLTVAQASAPGAPPIPKTEDEVQVIHDLTAGARRVNLMGKDATVERVQKEMTQSNWIHLACHGKQNSDNPMESGLFLHESMLKLSEIVKMSLPKADFAFLSACQTAMGDKKVADESVHLAAGMLLSGCQGVIATTWSIRDEDGPKIAEDVYRQIFKDGKPNREKAAYALHEAVKRLRESGAKCTSWVPFIHIGR